MKFHSKIEVEAKLFKYESKGGWFFLRVDAKTGQKLREEFNTRRGWNSIPVVVTIENFHWLTSIFPDKDKSYLLPVKKSVREKIQAKDGDLIKFQLQIQGL